METWFIIILTICISTLIKSVLNLLHTPKLNLPPGPPTVPIIGSFLWLKKSFSELEPLLRSLHSKYGPMVTLRIGSRAAIFVSDRNIAHTVLVQNGSVFSDRPSANATNKLITSDQHNISSAAYGPTWRLLRRNLTAEILHPSRIKSYDRARKWVLEILIKRFEIESKDGSFVRVAGHFQYAMFCLLVFMCFGDRVDEATLKSIERVQRDLLLGFSRFNVLNFWPSIGRFVFRKRWAELIRLKKNQEDVLIPLIRSRKQLINESKLEKHDNQNPSVLSYVDTLFELNLPDEKRKLKEEEIVSLCSEFLNAGTDTTSTALQWIMANLVKNPKIQKKLSDEINGVLGPDAVEVEEDDLHKMPYLKAVILEGLRRHPPGHFVLPHSVTEDVSLNGYLIPKNGNLNFMVAEMGWDPKVWEDPMQFTPERFLVNSDDDVVFDLTCSREIKMMPFGAGRRMCPASGLAMLHLEYFVANLVRRFEWTGAADGDEVDLSEKQEFTVVMKNPLNAHLSPRFNSIPLT